MSTAYLTAARTLVALAAGTACGLTGCSRDLNVAAVVPSITQGVADQVGLEVASVTCPRERRPLRAGDTFECLATVSGGGTLTIAVTQTDDTGIVTWTVAGTSGLLDLARVEASIARGLKSQAGVTAAVSCRGRWRSARKGDAFVCDATDQVGRAMTIAVTVVDDLGNVSWETQ